ncbi:MAG: YbhB/YbcL family Raf kinase inhibitor-like protein [Phycisphaerae bacterium]|nr:YbhB/YbcL family Raf kinase inhibitor-like protein [Phycisphaerae bacterium]
MTILVSSPAFQQGDLIPLRYSGYGQDISPPLQWEQIPKDTQCIALICDDPDAPGGIWVHWVMWNIPAGAQGLPEEVPSTPDLADGSRQGITDFGRHGYGGPMPPSGTHRYFFKVYALDCRLDLPDRATKADLTRAMQGHILAQGELMGRFRR